MDKVVSFIDNITFNKGNLITIVFGNKLDEKIFDVKNKNINIGFNIIPLITSIMEIKPIITKNEVLYHLDKQQHISKNILTGKQTIETYRNNLIDYTIINCSGENNINTSCENNINTSNDILTSDDILVKFNNYNKINNGLFPNTQNYNNIDNFIAFNWKFTEDKFKIILKLYKTYFTLNVEIEINENVELIPRRKIKLCKYLNLLEKCKNNYLI